MEVVVVMVVAVLHP